MNKEGESGASGFTAFTAATSTEPEASGGAVGAQTDGAHHRQTFRHNHQRHLSAVLGTLVALIEALHSNLAGSQQCIPSPPVARRLSKL